MMFTTWRRDLAAILERDPAARRRRDVLLTYPGLHALWAYRIAHVLWRRHLYLAARMLMAAARVTTGVDIHPAAEIGPGLFIDHALGVVIGETVVIGEDVTMFHNVTLGGTSRPSATATERRHPIIGDRVMIGAGATVLGPIVVGAGSRIGAGAVVLTDVAPRTVVVGVPARVVATTDPPR
jgi:serine O-acetyltransferase